ncbi:MAG: tRNA threonylcarbamoyladenosine dehydratase [Proteobacteria bacterium]|nr:tRNA threonylcarbamoyladenosine dehydratase [Pseudomonadota bacterium]
MSAKSKRKSPLDRRFDRNRLLIGADKQELLHQSHVMIFGLGGVGSYTAESLTRTGIGKISLVDHDYICVTNSNRQLHARKENLGKLKAEAMAEMLRSINPRAEVCSIPAFYTQQNSLSFFNHQEPDFVIDAIDILKSKVHLIQTCLQHKIPVASSMGAAGRMDPTKIRVMNIWDTRDDPLAKLVRKKLRRDKIYANFPVVCSTELPVQPLEEDTCLSNCVCPDHGQIKTCDSKYRVLGTISYITAIFGMTLAGVVINHLLGNHLTKVG